ATEIYTLSLHDALPISYDRKRVDTVVEAIQHDGCIALILAALASSWCSESQGGSLAQVFTRGIVCANLLRVFCSKRVEAVPLFRSEEHTSELQSRSDLV